MFISLPIPCRGRNKSGLPCGAPAYKFGYCIHHQNQAVPEKLPPWFYVDEYEMLGRFGAQLLFLIIPLSLFLGLIYGFDEALEFCVLCGVLPAFFVFLYLDDKYTDP